MFSEHSFEASCSHSAPWQMQNNDELHEDLAMGRNEKKELCMCLLEQDGFLFSPAFALGLPESDKCSDSTADQLVLNGGPGSCFIVLFCCLCTRFLLREVSI